MSDPCIAVVGSLNVDFITRTPRVPEAGETLTAHSFDTGLGGKGANQAVACARLAGGSVNVMMRGNVGDDIFGNEYMSGLLKEGIDTSGVRKLEGQKTGVANIIVDESSGENRILFTANANYVYSPAPDSTWDMVPDGANVVVFQLEIPTEVVLHNLKTARRMGKHTIFNPAPASMLPNAVYSDIDTLVMNESESAILAGPENAQLSHSDLLKVFLQWGVRDTVIITLGGEGLVYARASGSSGKVPAKRVQVVDTTAAGDTFVGGYAVQRAKAADINELDLVKALEFASLAASKTVERNGAMSAIPYLREI